MSSLNVAIVAQKGRIGYQALLSAASIREHHPAADVRIHICIPNSSELWVDNPGIEDPALIRAFERYSCELVHFENADFGSNYPHSNKFYSILSLPPQEPFLFLDSDTLLLRPIRPDDFNFAVPGLKAAGPSWPIVGRSFSIKDIWESLYAFFGLEALPYRDDSQGADPHQLYPYYQGNVMYYARAGVFGETMLEMAKQLWQHQPEPVRDQPLKPWLDQIVLPLLLAKLGVPRRGSGDPIRKVITHYEFPFFLLVQNRAAISCFATLSKDHSLLSVLQHDRGFAYYLSNEGREFVERSHAEFMNSFKKWDRRRFKEFMRRRAPMLR